MRLKRPQDIQYLSLEGGGGKGVTYLGAIRALEKLKVLPIDITKPGSNQIKGISGASAGAITALLLAMGVTSTKIQEILSKPDTFTGFFDGPAVGIYRSIDRNNKPAMKQDAPAGTPPLDFIRSRAGRIARWSDLVIVFATLARGGAFGAVDDPIAKRLLRSPEYYLYNLIFDRGLFPGFAPRHFFSGAISAYMSKKFLEYTHGVISSSPNGGDLNFELFYKLTGVDLVITGANVTTHRPAVFSRRHTPKFPVAEAVGISMNLPVLFKPVLVEADVPVGEFNRDAKAYHGLWVDGGLLNNFPLHAFDFLQPPVSKDYPELRPLHPHMLGLRLTDGPDKPKVDRTGTFAVLLEHLGNIANTVMYPSEEGQIRTDEETAQSIDLFTYDLQTTEFAPPAAKSAQPIEAAERAVNQYFGSAG